MQKTENSTAMRPYTQIHIYHQLPYRNIHMDTMSIIYSRSKLINKLAQSEYAHATNLATLFHHLDIHDSSSDIITLLTTDTTFYTSTNIDTIYRLGIERASIIFDELCAPAIIEYILNLRITLNMLCTTQIINAPMYHYSRIVDLYERGYRIIHKNPDISTNILSHYDSRGPIENIHNNIIVYHARNYEYAYDDSMVFNSTAINNAAQNGFYTSRLMINKGADKIKESASNISNEILHLVLTDTYNLKSTMENLPQFSYLKSLHIKESNICYQHADRYVPEIYPQPMQYIENLSIHDIHIDNLCLKSCIRLRKLDVSNNPHISSCDLLAKTLRILNASGSQCSIDDRALAQCVNIKELNASYNRGITTCIPFANSIVSLDASHLCGIYYNGLKICTRLKKLSVSDNPYLSMYSDTLFAHTLRFLNANGGSRMDDNSIIGYTKLKVLYADYNTKITTCSPFASTLKIISVDGNMLLRDSAKKSHIAMIR